MGDPKRIRRKYETPSQMWDPERIKTEHDFRDRYGLNSLHELWVLESELRRIRKNAREVPAGRAKESVGKDIIARLSRYGIVRGDATLDDLLVINLDALLERRLQTLVFKKGLAKSEKQARQLITHGLIAINGRRSSSPGRLVLEREETGIGYYKPVNINTQPAPVVPAAAEIAEKKEDEAA